MKDLDAQLKSHTDSAWLGMISMVGAGLGFSIMVAFVKASAKTLPVTQVVCVRTAITAIAITLFMYFRKVSFRGHNLPLLYFRALLGTTSIGLAFYSASVIPLVDMSIIIKSSVIFTALIAAFWLKEKPPKGLYFYTALGFLGVALIIKPEGQVVALGGIAALLAAVMIGWTGALIRRLQETEHFLTIIFTYTWMATVCYAVIFGYWFQMPTVTEAWYLVGAGVAGTLGQIFFTLAYKFAPASEVSPFLYSEVLFAAFFGAVYFQEIPDSLSLIGTALAVYAGISIARNRSKPNPPVQ